MKTKLFSILLVVLLICSFWLLISCDNQSDTDDTDNTVTSNSNKKPSKDNSPSSNKSEIPHSHSFGSWTVTTIATCHKEGEETRICSCGEKETRNISKLAYVEKFDVSYYWGEITAYITTKDYSEYAFEVYGSGAMYIDQI